MRDYIHVFVNLDSDLDGFLTEDNFLKAFDKSMNKNKIFSLFWDSQKKEKKKLDIAEFLDVMKPKDCIINKEVLRT
jgi:Ca2+-binding EF-hand superfamily protein